MSSRSLNKVQLIGNLTRDPELRYTPQGTAVCTFGLATNRTWTTDSGDKKEDVEFHRLVAWAKLAELCAQLLFKGRRIYIEGRLQTRSWTGQDNIAHSITEIVVSDMMILDSKRAEEGTPAVDLPKDETPEVMPAEASEVAVKEPEPAPKKPAKKAEEPKETQEVSADDIPF
ncbi:MAG: single-stranded DNA-binding protein [bacterium]|nr:single-stranded DNA-binding protein [bacterium]